MKRHLVMNVSSEVPALATVIMHDILARLQQTRSSKEGAHAKLITLDSSVLLLGSD